MPKPRLLLAVLAGLLAATPALADRDGHDRDDRDGPGRGYGRPHHDHNRWDRDRDRWDRPPPPMVYGRGYYPPPVVVVPPPPPPRVVYAPPPRVYYLDPYPAYPIIIGQPLPRGIRYSRMGMCRDGLECVMVGADMLLLDAFHGTVREILYGGGRRR